MQWEASPLSLILVPLMRVQALRIPHLGFYFCISKMLLSLGCYVLCSAVLSSGSLKDVCICENREGPVSILVPRTKSCAFHLPTSLHLGPFCHGSTCKQVSLQINFSRRTTKHIVGFWFLFLFLFSVWGKKKGCKYSLAFSEQEADCPQLKGCAKCVSS